MNATEEKVFTNRLLSIEEAATMLSLSPRTIRNQVGPKAMRNFPIKPVRIGRAVRFRLSDVQSFIDKL